ncbi:VOC family protein [Streptomyces sp. NPDC091279]|uniref:VOC family protein n=1 Tax=unclassified Streptomyces TaxID=2593676 RepID=UPI0037F25484
MGLIQAAVLVLDCAEPLELAAFYSELIEGEVRPEPGGTRVELIGTQGTRITFQLDLNAVAPSWPRPDDSQQAHLELLAAPEDLDEVERLIVGRGGRPLETRADHGRTDDRLYADPAGHPFSVRSPLQAPEPNPS